MRLKGILPELWSWMGLIAMAYSLFDQGPHWEFMFLSGFGAMLRGDILSMRAEIDRWRRL